jgi:hypothetical protein
MHTFPSHIIRECYIPANMAMPQSNFAASLGLARGIVEHIKKQPAGVQRCLNGDFADSDLQQLYSVMTAAHHKQSVACEAPGYDGTLRAITYQDVHNLLMGIHEIAIALPLHIATGPYAGQSCRQRITWLQLVVSLETLSWVGGYLRSLDVLQDKQTLRSYKKVLMREGSTQAKTFAIQRILGPVQSRARQYMETTGHAARVDASDSLLSTLIRGQVVAY